ncbi:MAG: efflux RND transporter periplasmic adaptor subunit [Deltaproteobacteria bacterium]|nr:efflux RND transporter periplasmic adaptor subunit [Deltaproteobacteria bacterium]
MSVDSTGDDPSPRALRAMALVRWLLLAAVATTAAATWWSLVLSDQTPASGDARFYCPMHPEIRSHDPGTCPVCFMTLEPIPADLAASPLEVSAQTAVLPGSAPLGTAPVMLTTERIQASGISVVEVRAVQTPGEIRWPAVVEALEGDRAEVHVRVEGFVERVVVRESGVRVRRGDVLAWLYSPELLRAQEELLTAHRWRERGETMEGMDVDEAASRRLELMGMTRGDIQRVLSTGEPRRRIALRAPIDGTVTRFAATLGAYASPEIALYEIVDYGRVRVVGTALDGAEGGVSASTVAVFEGTHVSAPLVFELVEPVLDANSRSARVRFHASNESGRLRAGQIGEVSLERAPTSIVVVPRDAVVDLGRTQHVFVETGVGLFSPRVVTVGGIRGDDREIVAGLEEGERVVARGGFVLDSESRLAAALAPRVDADAAAGVRP